MSAMDHKPGYGRENCLYCGERWPCVVARTRRELADHLREQILTPTGDYPYDSGRAAGVDLAADIIEAD